MSITRRQRVAKQLDARSIVQPRDGLHEMRGWVVAKIRADVTNPESAVGSQFFRVREIFLTEGHLDAAQKTVFAGDVLALKREGKSSVRV